MAQQTESRTLLDPSLKTIEALPSLAKTADNTALTPEPAKAYNALPLTHSKSTRVLRILPSMSDQIDTIHVELQTISLDDDPPPEFCALSYVWRSPSETRRIIVNDEPFLVRKNLWNFLDLMRRREFSDLLWIDAICINQDCIPERNHQVSVMSDIYKGAIRVIAWLGAESELVIRAEEVPRKPDIKASAMGRYSQAPLFDSIQLIIDDISITPRDNQRTVKVTDLTGLLFQKITELSCAEYWSRIWIVQEYTLARDVTLLTDRSQMNDKDFLDIYSRCSSPRNRIPIKSRSKICPWCRWDDLAATPMIRIMEKPLNYGSLSKLVWRFQESKCIDPRDHLYALLSLVRPEDFEYWAIRPDYSKSKLLLFAELTFKSIRRRGLSEGWTRSLGQFAVLLDIENEIATELIMKIVAKAELEDESGRQGWDEKIAEELAQLAFAVEQSHEIEESARDIDTEPC